MRTASGTPFGNSPVTDLLIALTTVVAAFATLIAPGSNYFEVLRYRVAYDAIAACALLPWLIGATVRPSWRPASKLMPAIAVCLIVYVISTATSRNVRLSAEMLGYAVLLAGLYLFLVALMRRVQLRAHFERLALLLCVIVCVIYLLEVGQQWVDWWGLLGHLAIPPLRPAYVGFIFPNPIATIALVLGAFALATLPFRGGRGTPVAIGLTLLVLATTFLTGSRGAWIGLAAGLVLTAGTALGAEKTLRTRTRAALRSPRGAGAVFVVAVLLIAGLAVAAHGGRLTIGDNGARESIWAASFRMFAAAPLTGVGPGVWGTLRAVYSLAGEIDLYIPHAHDIFIQALAEFGLLAVPAGVAVLAMLGHLIGGTVRGGDPSRRRVAYAALFSIVVLAGQQLVDVLVNVPAVLCAVALPVAWLDAAALGEPEANAVAARAPAQQSMWPRWLTLGAAGAVVITLVGVGAIERVAAVSLAGTQAADRGSWSTAAVAYAQAAHEDPSLTAYGFELGLTAANAGDLAIAEAALSTSAETDDYTYAWLDLAAVRWKLGDAAGARSALRRAERLGWQRADVALASGWLREQLGDEGLGNQDYGAALADMPALALDPFWHEGGRGAAWPAILDATTTAATRHGGALANADATDLVVRLLAGQTSAARAAEARLSPAQQPFYDLVIAAWTGDAGAKAELARRATAGSDPSAQAWSALIAARDGDEAAKNRYLAILKIDATEATGGGVSQPLRIAFDPTARGIVPGLERYGSVYRRLLPVAKVVGILPTLEPE